MDDTLILRATAEGHVEHVRRVLARLRERRLYAKLSKCRAHVQELAFLGYKVGIAGVYLDKSKVAPVLDWSTPCRYIDIQSYLGVATSTGVSYTGMQ